jgi:hypothetical protein
MSRLGQVSLTKPTYRRIVLRCCSVPQAKPSPDYEYRISLRPHPVGHPSSSTRDSASRAVPSLDTRQARRDGYREAAEWQQAEGDQRGRAAQKVFARGGSRKPRSDQHQECSTTDNHGYRRLDDLRADHDLFRLIAVVVGGNHDAVDAIGLSEEAATRPGLRRWRAGLHRDPWFV